MASFETVNYAVRPGKSVERKLVFEVLQFLSSSLKIQDYQYIGLGSMWFVDFVMAHRLLRIETLISIEKEKYAKRAKFNSPYSCIEVKGGDTSSVLPELNWERKSIVWLDFDSGPVDGPIFSDLDLVASSAAEGSFIIVTANAHPSRLPRVDADGKEISSIESARREFGGRVDDADISGTATGYPKMVAKALLNQIISSILRSGRSLKFLPLFNLKYQDNSPMVTVGGVVVSDAMKAALRDIELFRRFPYTTGVDQYIIKLPQLTPKEKASIDMLLPIPGKLTEEAIEAAFGFRLPQSQLDGYQNFYRIYPTYGEVIL